MMISLSLRLPEDLETKLAQEAEREGCARSDVARQAIADYLVRRERERFMDELVSEMRSMTPAMRAENVAMAEEAIATDNEALELAERSTAPRPSHRRSRKG